MKQLWTIVYIPNVGYFNSTQRTKAFGVFTTREEARAALRAYFGHARGYRTSPLKRLVKRKR